MIDPIDLRTFPPVEPLSSVPDKWRQTFLSKSTECPRSAYLYLKYNGGALTHPLAGGTILHRAIEMIINHMRLEEENSIPPEIAKDLLIEALVESEDLTVSPDRFDSMRSMIYHMAMGLRISPGQVVGVEIPVELDVGERTITGTIDFAEIDEDTSTLTVVDWKSAFHYVEQGPEDPDAEEPLPSNQEWPGTFQLVLYALELAEGRIDGAPAGSLSHIDNFKLRQVHPRQFWESQNTMAYREAVITRDALLDWQLYLKAVVDQVERAIVSWEFPAIMGHHCDYCPAAAECPIPAPIRKYRGEIRTHEDAARAAIIRANHKRVADEMWKALKGWAEATGNPIRYGRDQELRWKKTETEKVKDKVAVPGSQKKIKGRIALRHAVDQAVDIGMPFDWNDFHTVSVSTRLTNRTLTPHELLVETEQKGTH